MILDELRAVLGEDGVLTGDAVRERPTSRLKQTGCQAMAIVRPRTTAQVAEVLRLCHAAGQPVVPRAGMTGLVGGTMVGPHEIALSLEFMNRIEELDPVAQTMTVEAGVALQTVQERAATADLLFPLDLGARGSATIGGNIATNAGGNKVLRYGMMRDLVLGLEAVLPDGRIVSSLFKIIKNNSGLDLKQLFIGSEGTLGVVTRAVLRLRPMPRAYRTALCAAPDFAAATSVLAAMQDASSGTLGSFEVMWRDYYRLVTEPGRVAAPLGRDNPFYILAEWEDSDAPGAAAQFQDTLEACLGNGWITDAVIAKSEAERRGFWAIRDNVHYLRDLDPLFIYDIGLPITEMDRYIKQLGESLAGRWKTTRLITYGHVGDGNLHLGISCDGGEAAHGEVNRLVYGPLSAMRGSVSAEHGIGLDKKPYLPLTRGAAETALMATVKQAIDPRGILNPGKIVDPPASAPSVGLGPANDTRPVKVVVVTMFDPDAENWPSEFRPWVERLPFDRRLPFPLGQRPLGVTADGDVLGVVTGVGNARAAATVMALGTDRRFDLSKAYWVVAGIGGADPDRMPIGSAAWIDWVVDGDIAQEIDAREIPEDWATGRLPLGKSQPFMQPPSTLTVRSAYALNPALTEWAYRLTRDIALDDPAEMGQYRARFARHAGALQSPRVLKGALLATSALWHGELKTQFARDWVAYWTGGKGHFVASAMEDSGILQALHSLADAGHVDRERILILRSGSNYTVPEDGVTAAASLAHEMGTGFSAAAPSIEAAYRVARPVVDALLAGWHDYAGRLPGGTE